MQNVLIIAEAGVNHNGNIETAKKLVEKAADAGADIVKFQTFKANTLVSKFARKAEYQIKNTSGKDDTQFAMLKSLELSEEAHIILMEHCKKMNIRFLSTGFDIASLEYLHSLGLTIAKIPSGEITNLPYLRKVASLFKTVIISTGMAEMKEIKQAVGVLTDGGVNKNDIIILHCNTEYPTPFRDVNLLAMNKIGEELGTAIGYSDHTEGIEIPIAAVALGATVIEKHFTLDKTMEGPDHKASLEPHELKAMVQAIRHIEEGLGSAEKKPSPSEQKNIAIARKSIVALTDIKKGTVFSEQNITVKRPGNGISPMKWDEVIGTIAKKDFAADELIEL